MAIVNEEHLALCSSPQWARFVEDELLPWVLDGHDLGDALLEVGPGPGLTTDVLRRRAARLAAAAVVGLITGSTAVLAVLVAATIALWLTATIRHALGIPAKPVTPLRPVSSRDVCEVTDQEMAGRH